MKDPRAFPEENFEKIRRPKKRGNRPEHRCEVPYPCNGKKSYWKRELAEQAAHKLVEFGYATFLTVYRCPHCFKWHLTSQRPKRA